MLFQRYFRSRLCYPEQGGTFTGDFSTYGINNLMEEKS
jgi:hypothetical protein